MKIGIVAPANSGNPDMVAPLTAFAALAYPEVDLVFHPQCFESEGHFAGSDARRAAAFLEYANDPSFAAIWFARGGYGSNRILDAVMPALAPAARHKDYVGYSDMGFLLAALYARGIGRPAHGPMATDIGRKNGDVTVARSLGWMARREKVGLEPGLAGLPAAAFNLTILGNLIGTPWLPDLTDHVLMIEEVSEPMYNVDRLLFNMASATQLKGLAGVRLGAITAIKQNNPRWNETIETMIARWCRDMAVPYMGRAEIGHTQTNHVVPFGLV
jgi:muramoyltetrapeptide carboxypeptidase